MKRINNSWAYSSYPMINFVNIWISLPNGEVATHSHYRALKFNNFLSWEDLREQINNEKNIRT